MVVETLILGSLQTNCYIIKKDGNSLIVDPASNYEIIKDKIKDLNLKGILITHYHFDHIGALDQLIKDYNVPIYDFESKIEHPKEFNFEIIHNPGHTSDSVSFYFKNENKMFVGDFIFRETIGRTDLETGNQEEMLKSLENIKKYSNDINLYPGHYIETTLQYEKEHNPYLFLR